MSNDETAEMFRLIRELFVKVAKLEERSDTQHRTFTLWAGIGAAVGSWAFWIFTKH